jgi:hypothetical protein
MTVVAYAIGAVLVLAAVITGVMSATTLYPLVVVATTLAVSGVLLLLWRLSTLKRVLAEIRGANSVVAPEPIEPPRKDVAALIGSLRRLGFELIAATDTVIGSGAPIRTWVMTERGPPATTWVELGFAGTPIAVFLSRSVDGRFLETSFPAGATIDHPSVFARPILLSLEAALREHRAVLDDWTSRAGSSLAVRSLDEYRHVETELRERTGGMRIAAYLERVVEPGLRHWAISAAIGLVTLLTMAFLPEPPR